MVQISTLFVTAAIVAPVFAAPFHHKRENSDLETRKFHISSHTAGTIAKAVAGIAGFAGTTALAVTQSQKAAQPAQPARPRGFDDAEIDAREPRVLPEFTTSLFSKHKVSRRNIELDARDPRGGGSGGRHGRSFEAREARIFPGSTTALFSKHKVARRNIELDARDPRGGGSGGRHGRSFLDTEDEEMLAREFDDAEVDELD